MRDKMVDNSISVVSSAANIGKEIMINTAGRLLKDNTNKFPSRSKFDRKEDKIYSKHIKVRNKPADNGKIRKRDNGSKLIKNIPKAKNKNLSGKRFRGVFKSEKQATQLSSKNSLPISGNGKSGKGKIEKTMVKSDDARNTVMGNSVVKGKAHV